MFNNTDELKEYLISNGFDANNLKKWGKENRKKSLDNLLEEINNGECSLMLDDRDQKIKRKIRTVEVHIFSDPSMMNHLVEYRHFDANHNYDKIKDGPLREKLMGEEESPIDGAYRGISEELGNEYAFNIRGLDGKGNRPMPYNLERDKVCDDIMDCMYTKEVESVSYPGLDMINMFYPYAVIIPNLSNKHGGRTFETIEYKEDGSIKRYIEWIWDTRFVL